MTSIFSNTQSRVHVTILHDATLTADNRRRFERTAERWKQGVSFVDVTERLLGFSAYADRVRADLTRGALFRLLIPEILPVSRVIYLDCDTVVNLDITDLWAAPMGNFSLAAVKDAWVRHRSNEKIRRRIMGYDTEEYFNSGVLLMNLQRIREKYDLARNAHDTFMRYAHAITGADQDCLNVLFAKDVAFLDERFNRILRNDPVLDDSIIHFTGVKPWKIPHNSHRHHLFWTTFSESEWSDQMNAALLEALQNRSLDLFRTRECARDLLRRIPLHFAFYEGWILLARELAFRIRSRSRRYRGRTNENGVI
jgi:lipopolysaccharide biosynthesis glycosyltransferase